MQINIIGDIFGTSGYANHTRQLALGIKEAGGDVRIETPLPQGWEVLCSPAEIDMVTKKKEDDRVDIAINLPHSWQYYTSFKPKMFIGFCVWEGTKVPKFWIPEMIKKEVDLIFVPSNHVKNAILITGAVPTDKIIVIPHGVDRSIFSPVEKKQDKDKCVFIANKGWTDVFNDRGGIQFIIQAYAKEFCKSDNVKLIIKVNKTYNPNFNVVDAIAQLKVKELNKELPSLQITENQIPYKKLVDFYNDGDVFVTASMAEGFNLPCIEAMACGKPVITTNFGGQVDYINNENGWLVDYELITPEDIRYEGSQWAKIKEEELRKAMRHAYVLWQEGRLKGLSDKALETSNQYLWRNTGKKVLNALSMWKR
jgi:glycosyltransferase involved in cell wall biosynthesis